MRKKKTGIFVFGILVISILCGFFILPFCRRTVRSRKEYSMYMEFLKGNRLADGLDISEIVAPTGEPEKQYFSEYAYFDCDGDKFPELHIRSEKCYYIIDCDEDNLSIWNYFLPGTELLDNGDYLYTHIGGAPLHYDYRYSSVNREGEEFCIITFSCYDANGDGKFSEEDSFFSGEDPLSYTEWLNLTEKYLKAGTDAVLWTAFTQSR